MPEDPPDDASTGGDEDAGEEPADSPAGEPVDPEESETGGSTENGVDAPADANTPAAEDEEETGETEPAEGEDSESGADQELHEEADESGEEDEEGAEEERDDEDEAETGDEDSEAESEEGEDLADEDGEDDGSEVEGEEDGEDSKVGDETDSEVGDETDSDDGDQEDVKDGDDEDSEGEDDDESETDDEDEGDEEDEGMVEMHDDTTPIQRKTGGPESDKEQPLAEHIEEMIKRLAIVVIVAGVVSLMAFPFGEDFIIFLWYSVLPPDISQPHVYHPLELVITQLKAASLLGLVLALPVFVYETYAFMRPGLFPHERRYYLAAVPTSLILASVGLLFGYFLVLPAVMTYFLYYSRDVVDIAFALGQTFNLMLILLGYLAVVFQIPLFVMLAIMMGLVTRQWLEDRRLIFWGAFLGLSFLFSPDPTGMAPILVAATMVALFEGTLLLLRWTRHR